MMQSSPRGFSITLKPTPLTAEAFQSFGTVITSPLPPNASKIPHPPPQGTVSANQNTALKSSSVSPLASTYHLSPSGIPAKPVMSLYSCFPRALRQTTGDNAGRSNVFDVRILERHPYTTQTFVPMAGLPHGTGRSLIIVAPTLPTPAVLSSGTPYFPQASSSSYRQVYGGMPDLQNLKAFVAETGMGITYGIGTWHSPMVVLGTERVDFVVSQWMSGREEEDCQEVELADGIQIMIEQDDVSERAKL